MVHAYYKHHCVPLDYSTSIEPIWLVTNGSHGGIAGIITQGADWWDAHVATFFLAKLISMWMNYKIEMFAGVEFMHRHWDVLLGCCFT